LKSACRITIRLAEKNDVEAISATLRAAFAEFKTLYTPSAFSATIPTADQISERFAEGPIWIAEVADTIVGTVSAVPKGTELYIRSMAVRPDAHARIINRRRQREARQLAPGEHWSPTRQVLRRRQASRMTYDILLLAIVIIAVVLFVGIGLIIAALGALCSSSRISRPYLRFNENKIIYGHSLASVKCVA
jgi:hypothetical protein